MKIKEITIKALKTFLGHEEEDCVQGNIYFKGKFVGRFSDDSWGGPMLIDINDKETRGILHNLSLEFFDEHPYGLDILKVKEYNLRVLYEHNPIEGLINELVTLKDYEKDAKKMFKKGYKFYVLAKKNENDDNIYTLGCNDIHLPKVIEKYPIIINKMIEQDFDIA